MTFYLWSQIIYILTVTGWIFEINKLTLIKLKAEIRRRSKTGVVDRFFVQVISGVHIPPKLHKQLNHVNVLRFSCMMKGRLMQLGSIHICPLVNKTKL